MEYSYNSRRNRKGRPRSYHCNPPMPMRVQRPPTYSAYGGFCNFFIMSSLVAIIYIMLDYHCIICNKRCDLYNVTKGLDDIAHNISTLKESYIELEKTINKFSKDVPKIEGQIEILEALANTMERGDFAWNPKTHLSLPNVDVFLKEPDSVTLKKLRTNTTQNESEKNINAKY